MSSKQNFNQAMYDMFGVGKDGAAEGASSQPIQTSQPAQPQAEANPYTLVTPDFVPDVKPETTYLAPGTSFEGTLKVEGDVDIAGSFRGNLTATGNVILRSDMTGNISARQVRLVSCKLKGDIHADGMVLINDESEIEGNLHVDALDCSGKIKGDITTVTHTAFKPHGQLDGNLVTGTMTVEMGAMITGNVRMSGWSQPAPAAEEPSPAPAEEDIESYSDLDLDPEA